MSGRKDLSTRAWKAQSARVVARDGQCVDCHATEDLTADHIEPFAVRRARMSAELGRPVTDAEVAATYTDDELVTRCRKHNSAKGKNTLIRLDYRAEGWF